MSLRRINVNNNQEDIILTGLIVSDELLKKTYQIINIKWFKTKYAQKIAKWCIDYYHKQREAPKQHIEDIFKINEESLDEDVSKMIEDYLSKLSGNYVKENFNDDYIISVAMNYFRVRSADLLADNIKGAVIEGRNGDEINTILAKHKDIVVKVSEFKDVKEKEVIKDVLDNVMMEDEENRKDYLFTLPGNLGKYIGPIDRSSFYAFMGSMKKGKCVSGDTLVTLGNGSLMKISDIYEHYRNKKDVLQCVSFNEETQKFVVNDIVDCLEQGVKTLYKVTTRTGRTIFLTKKHPLLTIDGWKSLDDIQVGSKIVLPKEINYFGCYEEEDYKIKLLAYVIADGCTKGNNISFTKGEKAVLNDFSECVSMFDCSVSKRKKDCVAVINSQNNRGKHKFHYVNDYIKKQGLWDKYSYEKEIPEWVFSLNRQKTALFLNTLFTCDGSGFVKGVEYCSSSEKLARGVHYLLTKFGVISKIEFKENDKRGAWYITIKDYENMYRFNESIGFSFSKKEKMDKIMFVKKKIYRSFFDMIPFKKIKELIEEIRSYCKENNLPLYKTVGEKQWHIFNSEFNCKRDLMRQSLTKLKGDIPCVIKCLNQDIFWDNIVSIDKIEEKQTYDLCVKENHNFIADNILVHNSFLLQEVATQAVLSGLNVVVFNFEMNERKYMERIYKRFICKDKKDVVSKFPVFDCEHNLRNNCPLGNHNIMNLNIYDSPIRESFEDYKNIHKICTACRGERNFKPSSWFEEEQVSSISVKDVDIVNKMFKYSHGEMMLKCYPMGSANIGKIKDDLIQLEYERGFIPDVLILDYLDISAPEYKRNDKIEEINETWQWAKGLSDEKHIAVFSATQTNRKAFSKNSVEEDDTGGYINKLAHVDFMFTLNQTPEEKIRGILRVATLVSRWDYFDKNTQCLILQNLSLGQIVLDSEIIYVT